MNPVAISPILTTLLRGEVIGAAAIALGLGLLFGWLLTFVIGWRSKRDLAAAKDRIIDLQQENKQQLRRVSQVQERYADLDSEFSLYKVKVHNRFWQKVNEKAQPIRDEKARLEVEHQHAIADIAKLKALLTDASPQDKQIAHLKEACNDLEQKLGQTIAGEATAREQERDARQQVEKLTARIEDIVDRGSRGWKHPVAPNAPAFVSLGKERRCPIISMLNLKGGVGKTTITLNLAASLADQGKRILMIDCDHQRSLSLLCLTQSSIIQLHEARRTLQHFLLGPDRSPREFLKCIHPLPNMPSCSVLINSASPNDDEGLANVEDKLMIEWLTSEQESDVRQLLRRALHDPKVSSQFDYVLIDCPPRLSTATVNALAASDFVLIPVGLDALSATNALPLLLRELRSLRAPSLFPNFGILGIVANKISLRSGALVRYEQPAWDRIPGNAATAWGTPVHRFDAMIKDDASFARVAKFPVRDTDHAVVVWADADIAKQFGTLTQEIQQRIANDAPHLAALPS